MIAHVVLFRPKPDLTAHARATFIDALEQALNGIPLIRRARVGRRVLLGRAYDAQSSDEYQFAAMLEFENEADLREYLEHPAHQSLGEQFYSASEAAMAFDFELMEGTRARELL
jgi:Stress responsive A/B Barrel Domain